MLKYSILTHPFLSTIIFLPLLPKTIAMKKIFVLFVVLSGLFTFGCQSDSTSTAKNNANTVNEKVFGNLYVRYIQPDNQIKAEASFSQGSDKKNSHPIELKGNVSFQGNVLRPRKILDKLTKYSFEQVEAYKKEYSFEFEINDKKMNIPMKMASIDSIYPVGNISITKGGDFKFLGEPFSDKEKLVAIVSDKTNYATSFVAEKISNENTFHIPSTTFSKFKTGKGTFYLVRKRTTHLNNKNYELITSTEYYSNPVTIKIKK